jgi:hypothetical protein
MSADRKSFTAKKLDWGKCVSYDRRVSSFDFEVGGAIASYANDKTERARVSDQTIGDDIGHPWRSVVRARNRLRAAAWLRWRRTRNANIYELRFDQVERFLDMITVDREERKVRWESRKTRGRDDAPQRYLKTPDDAPQRSQMTLPSVTNTLLEHPKEKRVAKKDLEEGKGERVSLGPSTPAAGAPIPPVGGNGSSTPTPTLAELDALAEEPWGGE